MNFGSFIRKVNIKNWFFMFFTLLGKFDLCFTSSPSSIDKIEINLNLLFELKNSIESDDRFLFRIRNDFFLYNLNLFVKHRSERENSFSWFVWVIVSDDFDGSLTLLDPVFDLILFVFEIILMYILSYSDGFDFIFIRASFWFGVVVFDEKLVMKLILKVFLFGSIFELLKVVLTVNVLSESSQAQNRPGLRLRIL